MGLNDERVSEMQNTKGALEYKPDPYSSLGIVVLTVHLSVL